MKKLAALLLAIALLTAAFAVFAIPDHEERRLSVLDKPTRLWGYVVGDPEGSLMSHWISFDHNSPSDADSELFGLTTYAAANIGSTIYGYNYGYTEGGQLVDSFYMINTVTGIIDYPEGAGSNGEFVYGMAYNPADDCVYALCNEDNPYIARVDLTTGALTNYVTVNLGSALGVYTFAIDGEGNFYALTFSATNARLVRINKQNGALTELVSTNMPVFYAQSMTWDPNTNRIFWAHIDGQYTATNGLYSFDLENGYALEYHGQIATNVEVTGLCSMSENTPVEPTPTPDPTPDPTTPPTPPDPIPGDADLNGIVDMADALLALRAAMDLVELDEYQTAAADMNGDGSIGMDDALVILRKAMGLV